MSFLVLLMASMIEPRVFTGSRWSAGPPPRGDHLAFLLGFTIISVVVLAPGVFNLRGNARGAALGVIMLGMALGVAVDICFVVGWDSLESEWWRALFLIFGKAVLVSAAMLGFLGTAAATAEQRGIE